MNQASVGFHCPECSRTGRQKVVTARSLGTTPYVTAGLIAANVVVFLVDMFSGTVNGLGELGLDWALFGPAVGDGDWWRPITVGFVHSGLIHIGFNMLLLYQLGTLLEPALGRVRFVALYVMALLGGSFLVLVMSYDTVTVGASGAVFGLMGAAVVAFRSRGIDPFSTGIPQLLGLNLLITFVAARYISVGG
ncbi:MAG TPA: rhomboid family intramembrane serine protease, partial [Acidimicrobiales bacterium]|nr:rhomboid family intramembrane serine protease [Acidimicrobiales bacterium]